MGSKTIDPDNIKELHPCQTYDTPSPTKTTEVQKSYREKKICKCGSRAWYGLKGCPPCCCKKCKSEEMGLIKPRFCFCGKQANFGFITDKPARCKKCKENGMVNLKYMKIKGNFD